MIQARQLQLGNYVLDDQGEVFRIDAMDFVRQGYDCKLIEYNGVDRRTLYSEEAQPIPITEDWLVRFGFVFGGIYWRFPYNLLSKLEYVKSKKTYRLRVKQVSVDCTFIYHVHQLQNLYYALTQEELKLNDK